MKAPERRIIPPREWGGLIERAMEWIKEMMNRKTKSRPPEERRLDCLIREFPEDEQALRRLASFINRTTNPYRKVSPADLFGAANPRSQRALALIVDRLIDQGVLQKILSVQSNRANELGEYDSIKDVPESLVDPVTGRREKVRLDQVRLLFLLRQRL